MSENAGDKPFKTLKLTSLKSAKPASADAAPASSPTDEPTKVGGDSPAEVPVVSPVVPPLAENKPASESKPAFKVGGSLNMMSLKVTATPKTSAPETPSAATTPAPELSPPAASSAPATPFKVLTPTAKSALTESAANSAPVPPVLPVGAPPSIPAAASNVGVPVEIAPLKPSVKLASAQEKKAPVAAPALPAKANSKRTRVLALAGVAVVVLAVAALFATGVLGGSQEEAAVKGTEPPPPVEPVTTTTPEVTPPVIPVEPQPNSGTGSQVDTPPEAAVSPKTRRPELDEWLAHASITTVTDHRATINGTVYSLGSVVNATGSLKWIGRDTVTRNLLFIDDAGVVYTRAAGAGK